MMLKAGAGRVKVRLLDASLFNTSNLHHSHHLIRMSPSVHNFSSVFVLRDKKLSVTKIQLLAMQLTKDLHHFNRI